MKRSKETVTDTTPDELLLLHTAGYGLSSAIKSGIARRWWRKSLSETADLLDFPASESDSFRDNYLATVGQIIPFGNCRTLEEHKLKTMADMSGVADTLRTLANGERIDTETLAITSYVVSSAVILAAEGLTFSRPQPTV